MNLEDETLLSAFLDDELDAPQRAEVEAVLRSNPRLSRRLRDLSATRDLVAGLDRPAAPGGLPAAVLARLGRRPSAPRRLLSSALRLPAPTLVGAAASLAAAVIIAVSLTMPGVRPPREHAPEIPKDIVRLGEPPGRPEAPRPADRWHEPSTNQALTKGGTVPVDDSLSRLGSEKPARSSELEAAQDPPAAPPALVDGKPGGAPATAPVTPTVSGPLPFQVKDGVDAQIEKESADAPEQPASPKASAPLADNRQVQEEDSRRDLAAMLKRPGVRRMMVVADVIDTKTVEAFDDVLKNAQLKHPRQGRLAIAQGFLRDPGQPDAQGVIFAIAMDDVERGKLRKALAAKFPASEVREDTAPPAVAAQLAAEVGKFQVIDVEAAAGLTNYGTLDRQTFALKTEPANKDLPNSTARRPASSLAGEPDQFSATVDARSKPATALPTRESESTVNDRDLAKEKNANVALAKTPLRDTIGGIGAGGRLEPPPNSGGVRNDAESNDLAIKPNAFDNGRRVPAEPVMVLVWLTARPPR